MDRSNLLKINSPIVGKRENLLKTTSPFIERIFGNMLKYYRDL